jgi:cysteine-rich repeat protein
MGGVACGGGQVRGDAEDDVPDGGHPDVADVGVDWPEPDHGELPPDSCGNGVLDPGEECDDGNRMNGDGCDWACHVGDGELPTGTPDPDAGHLSADAAVSYLDVGAPGGGMAGFVDKLPLEWTGDTYATVWPHSSPDGGTAGSQATFIRFDTAGNRRDGWWTYDFGTRWSVFDLAWSGSAFGLCMADESDSMVRFVVLDRDGKPWSEPRIVGNFLLMAGRGVPLRVAADGAGYACTWPGLSFARLDASGHDRDAGPALLDSLVPATWALAWSGTSYLLMWLAGAEPTVEYLVLGPDLAPLAGPRALGPAEPIVAGGVWLGDRFAIAWMVPTSDAPYGPDSTSVLHVARLDRHGRLLGPPTPETDASAPMASSIIGFAAAAGAQSIAVAVVGSWGNHLRLVRFDREGLFIEQVELLDLFHETFAELFGPLGIAFDGSGFGVIAQQVGDDNPLFIRWALAP